MLQYVTPRARWSGLWLSPGSFEVLDGSGTGPSWGSLITREPARLPDGKV